MKVAVLWDPMNPRVPVGPVLEALQDYAEVVHLTFEHVGHRTLPNGHFELCPIIEQIQPKCILWVEGGPLPCDLNNCRCQKICWLVNAHLEPTLYTDMVLQFDLCLTTLRSMTMDESCRWLPLAASGMLHDLANGIHMLGDDPLPPTQMNVIRALDELEKKFALPQFPLVMCPGQNTRPHPDLFNSMAGGAITLVDPDSDMRDIGNPGEHFLVYPSIDELVPFIQDISKNEETIKRVSSHGPDIVSHLHTPKLRAYQLYNAIWPGIRVLSGQDYRPLVSVLTYCYKYLQRFRIYLESLANQNLPSGSLEIIVVDPESPDGLSDYLVGFASRNPQLRLVHYPLIRHYNRNRGVCINRAFNVSTGQVIISTDGDIIFPPHLIGMLSEISLARPGIIFGVRRWFLTRETTEDVLADHCDPLSEFAALAGTGGDGETHAHEGILGYCQAVNRKAFARARYPEEFNMVNQSDIVFLERLKTYAGVAPEFLDKHMVLHLWHPRNWSGAQGLL